MSTPRKSTFARALVSSAIVVASFELIAAATVAAQVATPTPAFSPGCPAQPLGGCRRPAVAESATFSIANRPEDDKDLLVWSWLKGTETLKSDFGNPLTNTGYDLCIYNGLGLIAQLAAPFGGGCGVTTLCWKETERGFKYSDFQLTPDGIRRIELKSGREEKARIRLKGKGVNLPLPEQPIAHLPIIVQLKSTAGPCWEAVYSTPLRNSAEFFRARAD